MSSWSYQALTKTGRLIQGRFRGTKAELIAYFNSHSLMDICIERDWVGIVREIIQPRGISQVVLKSFFEDMSQMMRSGIGLYECLLILSKNHAHSSLGPNLARMAEGLMKGQSLEEVFEQSRLFPPIVIASVACASQTGQLPLMFAKLSDLFSYQHKIYQDLANALIYPLIVLLMLGGIFIYFTQHAIPSLAPLLDQQTKENFLTRLLITFSEFFIHQMGLIVMLLLILFIGMIFWFRQNKEHWDEILYQIPIVGDLIKESTLSLSLSHLRMLLSGGFPLIKSIDHLFKVMPCKVTRHLYRSRDMMLSGVSFWEALNRDNFFPRSLVMTIQKAEQTVKWEEYLQHAVEYFDRRIQQKINLMTQLLQPLLLTIAGVMLLIIGLAFLIPVYSNLTRIAGGS